MLVVLLAVYAVLSGAALWKLWHAMNDKDLASWAWLMIFGTSAAMSLVLMFPAAHLMNAVSQAIARVIG